MTTAHEHAVSSSSRQGQFPIEFQNPPVAEAAIGFYFQRIEGWNILHHGGLWERFRVRYPDHEFLPPLLDTPAQQNIMLDLSSLPIRVGRRCE